jgi:hypothetical protein
MEARCKLEMSAGWNVVPALCKSAATTTLAITALIVAQRDIDSSAANNAVWEGEAPAEPGVP